MLQGDRDEESPMRFRRPGLKNVLVTALLAAGAIGMAEPAKAADFYAGKTIDFLVAGEPTIVVKNMPGAGSGRAAAYLFSVAPKDGTTIGIIFPGAVVGPLLEDRAQALYEPTKFNY